MKREMFDPEEYEIADLRRKLQGKKLKEGENVAYSDKGRAQLLMEVKNGQIIDWRRTSAVGAVEVLGRSFEVDPHWLNRLVRVEVDLDGDKIRIYRLRRREPQDQPLLREWHHQIKKRKFSE